MTRIFCNSVADIREALLTPIAQKQLTGIRGLMNHVASWSGRVIDRQAFLNDPTVRLCFGYEATRLEELLNDARREVSAEHLKRLLTRTFHSRCELVLSLADELKSDLAELLSPLRMFTSVERFAGQAAEHNWPMVSRELEGELEWLATNHKKPSKRRARNRKPSKTTERVLTAKQLEVLRLHGEYKGNMAEVARRMGIAHSTATQHYEAANTKLGFTASGRAKTTRLGSDHLGSGVKGLPARRRGKGVEVDD